VRIFVEGLLSYATCGKIKKIMPFEFDFTGGSKEFSNGKGGMTRLVGTWLFTGGRAYGAVWIKVLEVIAE
jgi:hypothetical protein